MTTLQSIVLGVLFFLLWKALSALHGRFRRARLSDLSVDALFDAVVAGHIDSEVAANEVVRRKIGSILTESDRHLIIDMVEELIEKTALRQSIPETSRIEIVRDLMETRRRLEIVDRILGSSGDPE